MKTFYVTGEKAKSQIILGEHFYNFKKYLPDDHFVIITDEVVNLYYGSHFTNFKTIIIGCGEKIKTLQTVEYIYQQLLDLGVDRSWSLVGIGGGIVCDITGFVASTYLRGIKFGFVATTLLAQVDAAIGGKNGVNFLGYKNMIGTFTQPEFILCDTSVLNTLPKDEISNGYAEIIKHALIKDAGLFNYLESNRETILQNDPQTIQHLVSTSITIKTEIVNLDEKEHGIRRLLNFGHTFGHAIEKVTGISHGKTVAIGSVIAIELSCKRNLIGRNDADRIKALIAGFGLPVELPESNKKEIIDALLMDKKRENNTIHFILLKSIGKAFVQELSVEEIQLNY